MTSEPLGLVADLDVRLPYAVTSARTARLLVSALLEGLGTAPAVQQDLLLLLHELVTNAVVHGRALPGGFVDVRCRVSATDLEIRVTDGGSAGTVSPRPLTFDQEGGRGLVMVAALSTAWWVDRSEGTAVTARLAA